MMKKIAKTVAALVGTCLLFTSLAACGSSTDAVVATVNGEEIYRWEIDRYYANNKSYYEAQSEEIDNLDDPQFVEERLRYRQDILELFINDALVTIVAKEDGYALSDEDKAEVDKEFQALKDSSIENYKSQNPNEANVDKKALENWENSLKEQNMTEDFLRENMYNARVREKFSQDAFVEFQPSDEDMKKRYEELVEVDKEKYENSPAEYFDAAAIPGGPVFYNPEGFVRVKQIMFSLPEEIDQQIRDIATKWGQAILQSDALSAEKGKDSEAVQELQNSMDSYDKQTQELYKQAYEQIKPRAEECYEKIKNGADFDEMIAEYGDDPSMLNPPISEYGYLIGPESELVKGLVDASLALENVGDISEPTESIEGYHIIQLVSKVEAGPVKYEDCKDFVYQMIVGEPQLNEVTTIASEKKNEVDENGKPKYEIKRYYDKLG